MRFSCLYAVPYILPTLPTWRQFTKSEGVDYTKLTYEEYCGGEGFQEQAKVFFEALLGEPITSEAARIIGVTGFLRGAEAMDSIKNFVDSAQADEREWVIGYIFCGLVEFGGVVYVVFVLFIVSVLSTVRFLLTTPLCALTLQEEMFPIPMLVFHVHIHRSVSYHLRWPT